MLLSYLFFLLFSLLFLLSDVVESLTPVGSRAQEFLCPSCWSPAQGMLRPRGLHPRLEDMAATSSFAGPASGEAKCVYDTHVEDTDMLACTDCHRQGTAPAH